MSLRFRLITLVALALTVSLAVGGAIACFNATRSVRTEMLSALQVGRQSVDNAIKTLQGARDPQRHLDDLVAAFEGNRHLRVSVTGGATAAALPVSDRSPFGGVPSWFAWVIGVAPVAEGVPVVVDGRSFGTIVIETDPHNEILEVWNQFSESVVTLGLFCGSTVLLIYLLMGHALRPLERLGAALEQVGERDYGARIGGALAPELARLRDCFYRMAARLAAADRDNQRLNEHLLTVQEQERSDIARDLHDEVSPFLFAINIDTANMARALAEGRARDVPGGIQSITEAVRHMQRHVRSMLGRLRPVGLDGIGLPDAVDNLIAFWRRRRPEIDYRVSVGAECAPLAPVIQTAICRIVQESISNALRHGHPALIAVTIGRRYDPERMHDEATVQIVDDGHGMEDAGAVGYGLLGMSERVRALGGRLALSNRPGGGLAVTAVLPCPSLQATQAALEAAP
jgi:two-component system, NarL family, sensor histidine kinase UhpB